MNAFMAGLSELRRRARFAILRCERGHASSIEFIWFVPILAAIISLIAYTVLARSAQIPVWTAARECARVASATTKAGRGTALGAQAALGSLAGNNLSVERATVSVQHGGGRSASVTCTVSYSAGLGTLPLSGWFGIDVFSVQSSYTLLAEPFRSDF